jgi:hypothetical protein
MDDQSIGTVGESHRLIFTVVDVEKEMRLRSLNGYPELYPMLP